jgi:hypothetical protein
MYGPQTPADAPQLPPNAFVVARRSTGLTVLVVAAVVVTSIVVMGIISAIAIPVFLAQSMRSEWRATTYVLPESFDGMDRTEVPPAMVPDVAGQVTGPIQVAYYQRGTTAYFVVAAKGKEPLTTEDQLSARRGFVGGMAQNGVSLSLTEQDAGRLGGWFGCGTHTATGATACLATDHAGIVMVVATGSADPAGEARKLREAVEKR